MKLVSHCRDSSNAVMQDVDPLDLVDGGDGELDGLIATIFDEVEVPANRSVGFYLNLLKEKHSKSALARQLQLLTGLHSTSMWIKNLGKWLKCRKDRAKHKGVYSATNWQIFLSSEVTAPAFPQKEKQSAETHKKKQPSEQGGLPAGVLPMPASLSPRCAIEKGRQDMRVLVAETARQTADMTAAKARAQTTQLEKELAQRTSIRSDPAKHHAIICIASENHISYIYI